MAIVQIKMAIVQIKIVTLETKIAIVHTKQIYTKKKICSTFGTASDITKKAMPPKSANPLPVAEIKKLKHVLKARSGEAGIDELAQRYSAGSTEDKRAILNKYIADRTLSFRFEIAQETELARMEGSTTSGRWMTLKQIAQQEGMQLDDPHLPLVIKDLPERDHENPALAAENVKQYRVEKFKDHVSNQHKEATVFRNTAMGMERVRKPGSQPSSALSVGGKGGGKASGAGLVINWNTANKGIKKNISAGLKDAMQAMSVSQKFRSSIETSSDKVALKDGQKILQESIEATEDIVEATLDTEIDHLRLKESLQALLKTTMAFRDLLYHVAPKAKPTPKEDK